MSQASPRTAPNRSAKAARPCRLMLLVPAAVVLLAPVAAQAEQATLRWTQSDASNVAGFRVHIGQYSGNYSWSVPLGLPTPNASGVYKKTVELGNDAVIFIALSSFNSQGQESAFSNENHVDQRSVPLGQPGTPQVVIDFN